MQKLLILVMVIVMIAIASEGIVSADSGKKVDVKGIETFEFNALFLSNLRSIPENITVQKETQ
jgi:hypothetical protein